MTNPNELITALMSPPSKQDPNPKRLEDFKLARVIGGGSTLDFGIGEPDRPRELPAQSPLFKVELSSTGIQKLPSGYTIRSLRKSDYDRGYTKLKNVGPISRLEWDERCHYLWSRRDTYTILVITDESETVVCTGTLFLERKLFHVGNLVGHIKDLVVAPSQKGKNLGLRMLEQLDHLAYNAGCAKSTITTQEVNEAFYKQRSKLASTRKSYILHCPLLTPPGREDFRRTLELEMARSYQHTLAAAAAARDQNLANRDSVSSLEQQMAKALNDPTGSKVVVPTEHV